MEVKPAESSAPGPTPQIAAASRAMRMLAIVNGVLVAGFAVLGIPGAAGLSFFRVLVVVAAFLLARTLVGRGRWPGILLGLLASAAFAGFAFWFARHMLETSRYVVFYFYPMVLASLLIPSLVLLANGWGMYRLLAAASELRLGSRVLDGLRRSAGARWIAFVVVPLGLVSLGSGIFGIFVYADRRDARIDAEVLAAAERHLADIGAREGKLRAFQSVAWRYHRGGRDLPWTGTACFEHDCNVSVDIYARREWRPHPEVYKSEGVRSQRGLHLGLYVGHPAFPRGPRIGERSFGQLFACVLVHWCDE